MAWVAVDKNSNEGIFMNKPKRMVIYWVDEQYITRCIYYNTNISLPKGSIKKLIGRDLTWQDEPVELKEE